MKSILFLIILSAPVSLTYCQSSDKKVGGGCEDCELMYEGMPDKISSSVVLASPTEPGERMILSGTIYKKDGISPASNVILYLYHTDYKGNYTPAANQKQARRHGQFRG